MNPTFRQTIIQSNLILRAGIISAIRQFFAARDFLEVETPVRIPAPAPEAHIDAEPSSDWHLQTSPELCMKRLLAAGYPRIYQICKCFRRKERGQRHLPEITLLEWYQIGTDYRHMMDQCQALVVHIANRINQFPIIEYQNKTINLTPPWPRMTVEEAFHRFGSIDLTTALKHDRFDEVMGLEIEPYLGIQQPIILYDYPLEHAALARLKPSHTTVAERFELYIAGLELCNAFTELNDAVEQRGRFIAELSHRKNAGKATYPLPELFLKAIESMPDASGNAFGIDRLVMLFADSNRIDDVVAFIPEEL